MDDGPFYTAQEERSEKAHEDTQLSALGPGVWVGAYSALSCAVPVKTPSLLEGLGVTTSAQSWHPWVLIPSVLCLHRLVV